MIPQNNLTVKIFRKIEQIPEAEWRSIFPAGVENYNFLKSLDVSGFDQFTFFYLMVYRVEMPVGAISCFTMHFEVDMTVKGILKTIFKLSRKIAPNFMRPKVLMCGIPMGRGRIGLKDEGGEVLELMRSSLEHLAREEKAKMIIYKDFTKAYDEPFKPLLNKGYSKVESIPSTEMDLNFNSFDEYLKRLSRVTRDGLKRNLKKAGQLNKIELVVKNELNDKEAKQVHELYLQTFMKQALGFEKLPPYFFKAVSLNMPNETRYFLWRINEDIAAFALCFVKGDYFVDYYLGFNYALPREYYLYFIRFRDLLKWCIENGIRKYEMGVTSYDVKKRLGFDFIRLYFYIKHFNPLINMMVPVLKLFLAPRNSEPVFKEMKAQS